MRVVFIGPFGLRVKGTMSRRALPMARALAARGHQVDIILPPWDCPEDSGQEWEEGGVRVHHITLPLRLPLFLFHLLVTWRLLRRALALKPEVVHCFKPKAYAGLSAGAIWFLKKLQLTKARLVVDSDDWEGWGGWNEMGNYTWLQKRLFAWQERWGLTHCDAVTVASRTLQALVWSLGVAPQRVFYVPNGTPCASRLTLHPSPFTVLLYTRFFEFQAERVVRVFERVAAEVPEARFLIVGRGFFGEEEKLLHLAGQRGLSERITYAGWVEPTELPRYLAAADMAIYPLDDNLLNRARCSARLVELMAAGLAIVAEDVGQSREYIVHGRSGLLVEAGDTETFAQGVVKLLRDEDLRRALGGEAQRRVSEEFAWEKLVERIENAYQGEESMSKEPTEESTGQHGNPLPIPFSLVNSLIRYWLPPVLWMGLIFFLSAQPTLPHHPDTLCDLILKKAGHMLEYGVLAFLLWRALSAAGRGMPLPSAFTAFVISALYAALDEYHQTFVPGRHGRLVDGVIDAVGSLIALFIARSWRGRRTPP